ILELSRDESGRYKDRELHALKGHKGGVTCLAFNPADARQLASGSADKSVIVWDVEAGKELKTFADQGEVRSLSFSRGGSRLIAGGADKVARVWRVATWQPFVEPFVAHTDSVEAVGLLRVQTPTGSGAAVVTAGLDGLLRLWMIDNSGVFV